MASRLWFLQLLVIQKCLIHFCSFFFSLFHCLDFTGIWDWLWQFGLWAAHQGMSLSQVLEVGVVAVLGNVQDGPLLPGTAAGLLRVWQGPSAHIRCTRLICQGLATGCCQPSQDWSSGKSFAQWDKPFLAGFCPSLEKGTSASHAEMSKSVSLGAYLGCGQNFSAGWLAWWRCTDKRKTFQKVVRIFRSIFCSQYSVKANLMEKRKISSFLCKEHKYLFQTIL